MELRYAESHEYEAVRSFYWELIDQMANRTDTVGWKKGIYPSDLFLRESIENKELYVMDHTEGYAASVILNSRWNPGYEGLPWGIECGRDEILVPHALAVRYTLQGQGIGGKVVGNIIRIAGERKMKTVRLDILHGNTAAERLYAGAGFRFVASREMFYEDTGWTEYRMYEYIF